MTAPFSQREKDSVQSRPRCIQCVHYFVTWHKAMPHGCKAMGFKSSYEPSLMAFHSSGVVCQMFQPKS